MLGARLLGCFAIVVRIVGRLGSLTRVICEAVLVKSNLCMLTVHADRALLPFAERAAMQRLHRQACFSYDTALKRQRMASRL
jgi:hypothetical protein